MTRYVALLRGINVGGKNLIKMADLKACFEAQGFGDVATYIQSGNVLFSAQGKTAALTAQIEAALSDAFAYQASLVLRSQEQMTAVVGRAPAGFGVEPKDFRYDVLFLKEPLTASAALEVLPRKEGVDEAWAGAGVLYFSRLIKKATSSQLTRVVSMPIYKQMTIRNWNTTSKLTALLDEKGR
ncbi:MAG: DUF1697 domain-containing protein [Polyangiaceae bacterium]|nr:DUF1697 domain-containing protein [Polyangiaceae bacterium]